MIDDLYINQYGIEFFNARLFFGVGHAKGRSLPGCSAVMQCVQWLTAVDAGHISDQRGLRDCHEGFNGFNSMDVS